MKHILVATHVIGNTQRGFIIVAAQEFSVDTWAKDIATLDNVRFSIFDYMKDEWTTQFGDVSQETKELLSSQLVNMALDIAAREWGQI